MYGSAKARAIERWKHLRDALRDHGVRVIVVPADPGQPGLVYPANAGFLLPLEAEKPRFEKLFPGILHDARALRRGVLFALQLKYD